KAVLALRPYCHAAAAPALIDLASDGPEALRAAAILALGNIGGTAACTTLGNLAEGASQPRTVQHLARRMLGDVIAHARHSHLTPPSGAAPAPESADASAASNPQI
ncbi:MAG: HEAT repeat domain-containing protein, partial [Roseiflexaceae bacterium]|nr:HEAT repeat domain-containing protein [Roseiflexaceae bacterium]